jgi:hypothetical protein
MVCLCPDQVGVRQNLETVSIGEQFDAANAFPKEGLKPSFIPSPKESTNGN